MLSGKAWDAEGNPLTGPQLTWTLDGGTPLGSGASVTADLPAGQHLITLKAVDAALHTGKATVSVVVAKPGVPAVAILSPIDVY
jgi:hypothetical protein